MAGGLTIKDIPSKRPSLANVILNAMDPQELPFITRMRKSKRRLTQMDHKYWVELNGGRRVEGATDGEDVTHYEGGRKRYPIVERAQEFRRRYKVGQQSQEIVEDAAVPDQLGKLRIDYGREIMRDVEFRALSDLPSAEDEGIEGRGSRFAGAGYLLAAVGTAMADNAIPDEVRIPADQIVTGTIANFNEADLQLAMENRRTRAGQSADLLALIGTKVQSVFDTFENYVPEVAGMTTIVRNWNNTSSERKVRRGIRFYEGSYGSVELQIDDYMPDAYRGYLFDMTQVEATPFGRGATTMKLPDMGGGPRELLKYTLAWNLGDPRAHIMFKLTA